MAKKSKSSRRWMQEHVDDYYVKQANKEGYRSRAVYKLMEINDKDHLLRPGMTVVDLGAAPGGWSQVAVREVGEKGRVIALDILPMDPIAGVEFIQGDFREDVVFEQLLATIGDKPVDLVISDIAPNISGVNAVDQPRSMYLVELGLDLAQRVLKPNGVFVTKLFQGEGSDAFIAECKKSFGRVVVRKPKASRPRSREVYLLASGFKM